MRTCFTCARSARDGWRGRVEQRGQFLVDYLELLLNELPGAFQSQAQTMVVPGLQQERALELVLKPAIAELIARRDAARAAS